MRVLGVLMVILAAACADGDDAPFRGPGGGGNTGTEEGPDAGPTSADGAPAETLAGQVCVILDWDDPFACADLPLSRQVQVADVATGGEVTTSDNNGLFGLEVDGGGATIRVGGEAGDLLVSTQSIHTTASSPVKAPAVDESLWDATLATLVETQTEGAGVVYVVDPGGPVVGATISFTTGVPVAARLFYDDGVGGFDPGAIATGGDGSALVLDVQNVGVRATLDDGRTGTAFLNTSSLEVGIATITLPAI